MYTVVDPPEIWPALRLGPAVEDPVSRKLSVPRGIRLPHQAPAFVLREVCGSLFPLHTTVPASCE